MLKKIAIATAATALVVATTAQAGVSALSLKNAAPVRSATAAKNDSKIIPGSPLFLILAAIGVVAVLEVTGAINIIGDDDSDSN